MVEEATGNRRIPKHDLTAMTAAQAYRQATFSHACSPLLPVNSLPAGSVSNVAAARLAGWTRMRENGYVMAKITNVR